MMFDLNDALRLVALRDEEWAGLKVRWGQIQRSPEDGRSKASVWQTFQTEGWDGDFVAWDTGEVELSAGRTDGWRVAKHYDLGSAGDFGAVLDDVGDLVEHNLLPQGARDWHADDPQ